MKRALTICVLALACCLSAHAQDWGYRTSIDLRYGFQQLKNTTDNTVMNSEFAFGASFYFKQIQFHKQPIGGFMYIGLDTGISGDFARYRVEVGDDYKRGRSLDEGIESLSILGDWALMEGELGVPIGPYFKFAPCAGTGYTDFRISAYYHIVPSVSGLVLDNRYGIQFNPFSTLGAIIGWKNIGIGYEYRMGFANYNMVSPKDKKNDRDAVVVKRYVPSAHNVFLKISF